MEFIKRFEAESVSAVSAVRGPFAHLVGVECGLRAVDGCEEESRGFASDGVLRFGVGEVWVKGEPQAGAGTGGASAGCDAGFIEIPFGGLAPNELKGACGVVKGSFYRWNDVLGLRDVAVVDGDYGDTGLEVGFDGSAGLVTGLPAASVDVEKDWGWLVRLGFPEVEDVSFVGAVFEVFDGGWNRVFPRGFGSGLRRWGSFGGLSGGGSVL